MDKLHQGDVGNFEFAKYIKYQPENGPGTVLYDNLDFNNTNVINVLYSTIYCIRKANVKYTVHCTYSILYVSFTYSVQYAVLYIRILYVYCTVL